MGEPQSNLLELTCLFLSLSHLQSTTLQRPVIPTEFGAKVPTNIRQRYLNLFIDECLKFCSSSQEAFDKVCTHPCFTGIMFAASSALAKTF